MVAEQVTGTLRERALASHRRQIEQRAAEDRERDLADAGRAVRDLVDAVKAVLAVEVEPDRVALNKQPESGWQAVVSIEGMRFISGRGWHSLIPILPCRDCGLERVYGDSFQTLEQLGGILQYTTDNPQQCSVCVREKLDAARAAARGFERVEPAPTLSEKLLEVLYEVVDARIRERENG